MHFNRKPDALKQLLCRGLPQLAEAVNRVASQPSLLGVPAALRVTPLHCACLIANWDAALAMLAAGARVEIGGEIDGSLQTMAEWARRSAACKHRGVRNAIATRAHLHQITTATLGAWQPERRCSNSSGHIYFHRW
jgi:hypothetical protein